ncbi:hypothetical protein KPH14_012458 [Odynerus spinipes]|uniref:Uncharacterized protein n=1 Tax=Odynerus spinipes TaxID=1348599 RepID=A0AAD9RI99_9HYME|nr:hypothetical protein KPH14_012458 [Odynerus spinipes]
MGYLHWEQIERESTTDVILKDLPKLEDLGVNPALFEEQAPWILNMYHRQAYYMKSRAEYKPVAPLEYIPV